MQIQLELLTLLWSITLFLLPSRVLTELSRKNDAQTPLDLPLSSSSTAAEDDDENAALFSLHRELVNIESTPSKEHAIGVFLEQYLRSLNFTVERQNVTTDLDHSLQRFNVFAYPSPSNRETPVLLTSHMDTVPVFYPYRLNASNDDIWGRGSVDAKACVATQIQAALRLRSATSSLFLPDGSSTTTSLADRVSLLFVVGEEVTGDGMRTASSLSIPWRHVIFGEPTEGKLVTGHKGLQLFSVIVHGVATHSGYPWLGHCANTGLMKACAALQAALWPWSEKYGNSTLNVGRIGGGTAANVMAERAEADMGLRIAAGNGADSRKIIEDTLASVEGERLELIYTMQGFGPVDIDADVDGFETMTVNYGTDIPNLKGEHKRYLYGPGSILVAHSDHEHLYKRDLVKAVDDYERLVRAVVDR